MAVRDLLQQNSSWLEMLDGKEWWGLLALPQRAFNIQTTAGEGPEAASPIHMTQDKES